MTRRAHTVESGEHLPAFLQLHVNFKSLELLGTRDEIFLCIIIITIIIMIMSRRRSSGSRSFPCLQSLVSVKICKLSQSRFKLLKCGSN